MECKPKHGNLFFCEDLLSNTDSLPPNYSPLLVFINAKSGGQQGLLVLREMRKLLTREQVISLMDEEPGNIIILGFCYFH